MKTTESQPLVSIIIPHWNNYPILEECLESLRNISYQNYEIIVTDNASADGSPDKIKQHFPEINLVENETNEGFAGGCNRGANRANGKFLLFLNNDTTHEQNWIEPLVNQLEQDESIAAVQPKILNFFQRDLFDYAGGSGGHMDILCFPFARGRIFLEQEIDTGQYNKVNNIFWASGTAIMIRKNLFEQVGKFDITFFAHMEEIDLCWRFHMLGYRVLAEPSSIVYHKNAVTLPMHSQKKYFSSVPAKLKILHKDMTLKNNQGLLFSILWIAWPLIVFTLFRIEHSRYMLPISAPIVMITAQFLSQFIYSPNRFQDRVFKISFYLTMVFYLLIIVLVAAGVVLLTSHFKAPTGLIVLSILYLLGLVAILVFYKFEKKIYMIVALSISQIIILATLSGEALSYFNRYPMKLFSDKILYEFSSACFTNDEISSSITFEISLL